MDKKDILKINQELNELFDEALKLEEKPREIPDLLRRIMLKRRVLRDVNLAYLEGVVDWKVVDVFDRELRAVKEIVKDQLDIVKSKSFLQMYDRNCKS